jgi:hypothetical protein
LLEQPSNTRTESQDNNIILCNMLVTPNILVSLHFDTRSSRPTMFCEQFTSGHNFSIAVLIQKRGQLNSSVFLTYVHNDQIPYPHLSAALKLPITFYNRGRLIKYVPLFGVTILLSKLQGWKLHCEARLKTVLNFRLSPLHTDTNIFVNPHNTNL